MLRRGVDFLDIRFVEVNDELFGVTANMITDLMNYHRRLNCAPKEFWQTDEESRETLNEWQNQGTVYNVYFEDSVVGFFYIRFGGQDVAWLEDLFIAEEFRGRGIGKQAFNMLDELMKQKNVNSMFVNVIPRNTGAIEFYLNCGFDHLNMIELRKNYDQRLNKTDEVEVLGFKMKKY
jgi:GNAT superfamily N-acetyltransferase